MPTKNVLGPTPMKQANKKPVKDVLIKPSVLLVLFKSTQLLPSLLINSSPSSIKSLYFLEKEEWERAQLPHSWLCCYRKNTR